jgi:hypothetical protein
MPVGSMAICAGMAETRRKPDLCMRYFQRHDGTTIAAKMTG